MFRKRTAMLFGILGLLVGAVACRDQHSSQAKNVGMRSFAVTGVVEELKPGGQVAVIRHEAISNYMAAMTMPFRVKNPQELTGVRAGDTVRFRLLVTEDESWIEAITKTGATNTIAIRQSDTPAPSVRPPSLAEAIADITFTNELGHAVHWSQFKGEAVAFTFFFTRCPLPEYCPRLSKNFAETSRRLKAMTNAPANWRLLSISFDPEFDKPSVMRVYGSYYQADSNHWNFLATSPSNTARFASLFGLNYRSENGTINHDFRTVVIDAIGRIQAAWPMGGDASDFLVAELIKGAAVTNSP